MRQADPPASAPRHGGSAEWEGASGLLRASSVPLYFQLAEILKERIEAGHWPAGERFPSERELADEFGISRTVIRPALKLLASDGQLVRVKGRGTFVTPPKTPYRIHGLVRMLTLPREPGVEVRILTASEQHAEPDVRGALGLEGDEPPVLQATAVILRSGSPVYMSNSFIVRSRLPALPAPLTEVGSSPPAPAPPPAFAAASATVATACLSQWEATQLGVAAGELCFLIRYLERVHAADGTSPVEFARIVFRSDVVALEADLC